MELRDVLAVLWRRRLGVLTVIFLTMLAGVGVLNLQPDRFQSTSQLVLTPESANDISFYNATNAIVSVYANAAGSVETHTLAETKLGRSIPYSDVSVITATDSPIIYIRAEDGTAESARAVATAISEAASERSAKNEFGLPAVKLSVLDAAGPAAQVSPKPRLTLTLFAVIALIVSAGFALAQEHLTRRIEDAGALTAATGLPVMAQIPTAPAISRIYNDDELGRDERLAPAADALRGLRANLMVASSGVRSIAVASAVPESGKTTISYGLAVTFARLGANTVVVDADLRKRSLSDRLGRGSEPGLWEALTGRDLRGLVLATEVDGLSIVPAGRPQGSPGDALDSRFAAVLSDLERMFDIVVIDTPPVTLVGDARTVAAASSATILVADRTSATRHALELALAEFALISVRPVGAVLNRTRKRDRYEYTSTPLPSDAGTGDPTMTSRGA